MTLIDYFMPNSAFVLCSSFMLRGFMNRSIVSAAECRSVTSVCQYKLFLEIQKQKSFTLAS